MRNFYTAMKSLKFLVWLLAIVAAAVSVVGGYIWYRLANQPPPPDYFFSSCLKAAKFITSYGMLHFIFFMWFALTFQASVTAMKQEPNK
jgi:hypothetical protein